MSDAKPRGDGGRWLPRSDLRAQASLADRDYTDEEREFLLAIDRFKRENRRPYPTWREVLAVLKSLGYVKITNHSPGTGTEGE